MCEKRNNGTLARCYQMQLLIEQTNGVAEVGLDGAPVQAMLAGTGTGIVFVARDPRGNKEIKAVAFTHCPFKGTQL